MDGWGGVDVGGKGGGGQGGGVEGEDVGGGAGPPGLVLGVRHVQLLQDALFELVLPGTLHIPKRLLHPLHLPHPTPFGPKQLPQHNPPIIPRTLTKIGQKGHAHNLIPHLIPKRRQKRLISVGNLL